MSAKNDKGAASAAPTCPERAAAPISKFEAAAQMLHASISKFEEHASDLPIAKSGGDTSLATQEAGDFQNPAIFAGSCQKADGQTPAPEPHTTDWQPIETAPKDGRHVILYCDYYGIGRCAWESWRGVWRSDDPNHGIGFPQPTHWMPLPDYPAGSARAENARRAAATTEGQP